MKRTFHFASITLLFCFSLVLTSCNNNHESIEQDHNEQSQVAIGLPPAPYFNEDSSYAFVKAQVDFGPRVPGTEAHAKTADWLANKLRSYGWEVLIQSGNVATHDGKKFNLKNIIASWKPELSDRLLLVAHWDTRPIADRDSVRKDEPIDGADDGASGPGVWLEIARQISLSNVDIGLDIFLNDLEDYGKENDRGTNTWCLGTQYWSRNPHKPGYYARYGILLDMVGAKGATFPREGISREYAPYLVKKIWNKAAHLGYSHYFVFQDAQPITDDHYYINVMAKIPCVDIIHMDPQTGDFGHHHHRHSDNMDVIDKNTLKAVGQTVLEILWEEQKKNPS